MTSDSQDHPTPASGSLPALDARDWPVFEPGWVWMTGGGPGDPGLITLHALNALKQAPLSFFTCAKKLRNIWNKSASHI